MDDAAADRALASVAEVIAQAYRGRAERAVQPRRFLRRGAALALALGAAAGWFAWRRPAEVVTPRVTSAPPPPAPSGAGPTTVINGDIIQNVPKGGQGVIGNVINPPAAPVKP